MKLCLFVILCLLLEFGNSHQTKAKPLIKYTTRPKYDINIKLMVHLDQPLTMKLVNEYKSKTRKKLKMITNRILNDARSLFRHSSLNQTINFDVMDTRFLRNNKVVAINENAGEYLKNYCDWQTKRKIAIKTLYYSVLLTGLDLFHVNNGKKIRTNSGRSYTRGMCSIRKSCALIEWNPKIIGFLLAHEIGHSLGMNHDGPPYNQCKEQTNIMAMRYDPWHHAKTWSTCSLNSFKQYLINHPDILLAGKIREFEGVVCQK